MRFPPAGTRHSVTVQRRAWRVQKAPDLLRATDATLAVEAHLGGGRPATAVCPGTQYHGSTDLPTDSSGYHDPSCGGPFGLGLIKCSASGGDGAGSSNLEPATTTGVVRRHDSGQV
jgi:hypothetical protein